MKFSPVGLAVEVSLSSLTLGSSSLLALSISSAAHSKGSKRPTSNSYKRLIGVSGTIAAGGHRWHRHHIGPAIGLGIVDLSIGAPRRLCPCLSLKRRRADRPYYARNTALYALPVLARLYELCARPDEIDQFGCKKATAYAAATPPIGHPQFDGT